MSNEHWVKPFFEQEIISLVSLSDGRQHHLDLIELADQSRWVAKLFYPQTWLGQVEESNLEFTERLAAKIADELGISFAAYKMPHSNKSVITIGKAKAIIRPYCEGKVSSIITEKQALKLGHILAQLHSLQPSKKDAKPFPSIILTEKDNSPAWIQNLVSYCNCNMHYQAENWVVSHRDIHAENIVWRKEEIPHLLDWESAGLIHPAIELIGLAQNCAGFAYGDFQAKLFRAALMSYGQQAKALPKVDSILWKLSFHTWLLWYSYCLRQNWLEEARHTLDLIRLIKENVTEMLQIYSDCQFSLAI